jgi:hypothetical protein
MNEISGILSHRLTSQAKVSLERVQQHAPVEISQPLQEMNSFEIEMEKINHAFALTKEIRLTLESALRDLNPD